MRPVLFFGETLGLAERRARSQMVVSTCASVRLVPLVSAVKRCPTGSALTCVRVCLRASSAPLVGI